MRFSRLSSIAGLFSIAWMGGGFVFFYLIFVPYVTRTEHEAVAMLGLLVAWIGIGLSLAIAGIRRGNPVSRDFGYVSLLACVVAAWVVLSPLIIKVRHSAETPNQLDAVNPAFASLLHVEHRWRGVGDMECSTATRLRKGMYV